MSFRCCCSHLGRETADLQQQLKGVREEEKIPVLAGGNRLEQTLWKWLQQSSKALMCSAKPTQGQLGRSYSSSISAACFPVTCSLSFHSHQRSEEKQLSYKDKASVNILYLGKQAWDASCISYDERGKEKEMRWGGGGEVSMKVSRCCLHSKRGISNKLMICSSSVGFLSVFKEFFRCH